MSKETGRNNEVLIATLGENPQVVIHSLELLQAQGYHIDEVVSVYTSGQTVEAALARLDEALQKPGSPSHEPVLVTGEAGPVYDFWTEADVTALLQTLYREVKVRKQAGRHIHLMLTGPKVVSTYALVVAQLLFDTDDQAWHLFSASEPSVGGLEDKGGADDRTMLVSVPVLRWTPMATMTTGLAPVDDPWQVINRQQELQQREHDIRLRAFLQNLPRAQRDVARLLAEGLDNRAIAARRGASINTVPKQISAIYTAWRSFFGLPDNAHVRNQIAVELAAYFTRQKFGSS